MFKTLTFAATLMALGALPAQAFPGSPVQSGVSESDVIQVADGCGRGWYRDRYGNCRRMGGGGGAVVVTPGIPLVVPPVVVAPRVYAPAPRACPRGMRLTQSGRCVYY